MKIFLDDFRVAPDNTWTAIRDPYEVKKLLSSGIVKEISFDHDLGLAITGYDVMVFLEELVFTGKVKAPVVLVHSANSGAYGKMAQCATNINNKRKRD